MPRDAETSNQSPPSAWPQLSRAPIVEGLVDIRVRPSGPMDMERLHAVCDSLAESYTDRKERRRWMSEVSIPSDAPPSSSLTDEGVDGVILRSADQKWFVQFSSDGMSVSRLEPYTGWEELKAQSIRLWDAYRDAVGKVTPIRLACRYINRLPLIEGEQFEEMFRTHFVVAPEFPQTFVGSLLRFALHFDDVDAVAILTQSVEPGQLPSEATCIFDIDAFDADSAGFAQDLIWERLETLRGVKNRAFFKSLTDKAVERFR